MKIIDTHIHVWDLEQVEYGWLEGNTSILNKTYAIDELTPQTEAVDVKHGVMVQAANSFEDTNWMLEVADSNEWIAGVVGWMPILNPSQTVEKLEEYTQNAYFKGARHLIHDEADPHWILQADVVESLKALAQKGITYDIVGNKIEHIQCVQVLNEKVPELKTVFDHLNNPPTDTREIGKWGEEIKVAAENPNVFAKISGLGTASSLQNWGEEDIKPFVGFALEHFGVERCFCGGDWPVSLLAGDYASTWEKYQNVLRSMLSETEVEQVLFHNANAFYRLGV